jgi:CRISPR/Cas system CSM-associated protein Csm3 (group 7 of RAMP superfamily)
MNKARWSGESSRKIVKRIVVEGDLTLLTATHFGNGDAADLTDMPLLVAPDDEKTPLLTGASLAGSLRACLREREHGYRVKEGAQFASASLFGSPKQEQGEQSPLIIEDAYGRVPNVEAIEVRDRVTIDPKKRTAKDKALYSMEMWQAGRVFPLRFELLIRETDDAGSLTNALAAALVGLEDGTITLGARKRRGCGQAKAGNWRVKIYNLLDADQLLDWVERGADPLPHIAEAGDDIRRSDKIIEALEVDNLIPDTRHVFRMEAAFTLEGSLLIRSGGWDISEPDMVHLRARHAESQNQLGPILSGTSLAGALRARALKIANTLATGDDKKAKDLLGNMFGPEITPGRQPRGSRVTVRETVVKKAIFDLVQNRVSIDRFTGGARDTALFDELPAFGGDNTEVTVEVALQEPKDCEIGLLLLLLKDLWTGDLPLGGEASIGRGRLKGKWAKIYHGVLDAPPQWELQQDGSKIAMNTGGRKELNTFITELKNCLEGAK